ncbi:hypothetical protein NX905_29390, partial [Burkholderia thailandensis]|uniref:hypothetical protein n=1 Tax=Burkholderia thailandensis TaxID=57975 RepID=UPI003F68A233|nr:hypothetical protein [Burkholderia thailandensis]
MDAWGVAVTGRVDVDGEEANAGYMHEESGVERCAARVVDEGESAATDREGSHDEEEEGGVGVEGQGGRVEEQQAGEAEGEGPADGGEREDERRRREREHVPGAVVGSAAGQPDAERERRAARERGGVAARKRPWGGVLALGMRGLGAADGRGGVGGVELDGGH